MFFTGTETAEQNASARAYELEFARIWRDTPKIVFSKSLAQVQGNATLAAIHLDEVKTHTSETTTTEDRKEWRITFRPADAPQGGTPTPVIQAGGVGPAPTPHGLPSSPVPVGP